MIKYYLILALTFAITGCTTNTPTVNRYRLDIGIVNHVNNSRDDLPILRLLPTTIDAPFSNKGFVYQTDLNEWTVDPYHQFITPPNTQITQAVETRLNQLDTATIVASDSLLQATYLLQLHIRQLYADYLNPKQPVAKMTVDLNIYQLKEGKTTQLIQQTVNLDSATTPNDPNALIAAYNNCLTQLIATIRNTINHTVET